MTQSARRPDYDVPAIVSELVEVIGEAAYLQLAAAMGGACFYVPRHPGADHPIAQAVGAETAALIGEYWHGQQLVLPIGEWRRRAIIQMGETLSGDDIARQLRLSRSYVYEVLAKARRQRGPDLFD